MKKLMFCLFTIFISVNYGQLLDIKKFQPNEFIPSATQSTIIQTSDNNLMMLWADTTKIFSSKSTDLGENWGATNFIYESELPIHFVTDINAERLNNGTILLSFKSPKHFTMYSEDNGETWSEKIELKTQNSERKKRKCDYSSIVEISDTSIWFLYSYLFTENSRSLFYLKSKDGKSWSEEKIEIPHEEIDSSSYTQIIPISDKDLLMIYESNEEENNIIFKKLSNDGGGTWGASVEVIKSGNKVERPIAIKDLSGKIWLFYQSHELTPFEEITQSDVLYVTSEDNGSTWSDPVSFTEYKGFDGNQNVGQVDGQPIVSFNSNRFLSNDSELKKNNIYYGIPGISKDNLTPPVLYGIDFRFEDVYPNKNMIINTQILDNDSNEVIFHYTLNKDDYGSIELYDDSENYDLNKNDKVYGNIINDLSNNFEINYVIEITDSYGNVKITDTLNYKSPFDDSDESYAMDINNIWLPLNNRGVIADVKYTRLDGEKYAQGRFEESHFLYSTGFTLTGYMNGELWGNGVFSATRIEDYLPGKVGGDANDEKNRIYYLKKEYPSFSETWQMWKDAVSLGADFYDGDEDGTYNPIDKNGNGAWDENEDKPIIIGDQIAWCIYNDGTQSSSRQFPFSFPLGIEIKQTMFAYSSETNSDLANVVFVKYEIENTGVKSEILDSVYFGILSDMDIGEYLDDLLGCDTVLNSSYYYNDEYDNDYGSNPLAVAATFVQGPISYIPNVSYNDQNNNNLYEEGIDIPIDTAKVILFKTLEKKEYPGAINQKIKANSFFASGVPNHSSPNSIEELRCNMIGKNQICELVDPCVFYGGSVLNVNCEDINPKFIYSGDPVTQNGWINNSAYDQRNLLSSGPFVLEKGKPIEIIIAYSVGRGTDALNSVTVTKDIVKDVLGFYNNNFTTVPVGVKKNLLPVDYSLQQNYPNPFNPDTKIEFSIPKQSNVKLEIFDVIGRKVKTLVNKEISSGNHTVNFNASSLSSGIYFYRIISDKFISTKKMILLK